MVVEVCVGGAVEGLHRCAVAVGGALASERGA